MQDVNKPFGMVDIYGRRWFVVPVGTITDPQDYINGKQTLCRLSRNPESNGYVHVIGSSYWQVRRNAADTVPQVLPHIIRFGLNDDCNQTILDMWMIRRDAIVRPDGNVLMGMGVDSMDLLMEHGYINDRKRAILNDKGLFQVETIQTACMEHKMGVMDLSKQSIEIYNDGGYFMAILAKPGETHVIVTVGVEQFIDMLGSYLAALVKREDWLWRLDNDGEDYTDRVRRALYHMLQSQDVDYEED